MSIGRRNWNALSSLAKQWSIEDEEEQERERRRRFRMNSSVSDSEESSLTNGPARDQEHPVLESPEEEEAEGLEALKSEEEHQRFLEMLRSREDRRQKRHLEVLESLKMEQQEHHRWQNDGDGEPESGVETEEQGEEQREEHSRKEQREEEQETGEKKPLNEHLSLSNGGEHTEPDSPARNTTHEAENQSETLVEDIPKTFSTQVYISSLKMPLDRSSDTGTEKSKQQECSDLEFHLQVTPQKEPDTDGQKSLALKAGSRHLEQQAEDARSHKSQMGTEQTQRTTPSGTPQINDSLSGPSSTEAQQTDLETVSSGSTGTPFRRSTPRGTSFRVVSRKQAAESNFQRSASLRIPSSRLGEKLERYTTAIQRSDSVKTPTSPTKGIFLPKGVASKRSLFERTHSDVDSRGPSTRKDTPTVHGGVTSRLKWIGHSPDSDRSTVSKEVISVDVSSKRNLWEQRSVSGAKSSS